MKTRLALLAVWLALPFTSWAAGGAIDGVRLSASDTAGIAGEKYSGNGSYFHSERFLLCDGQHRTNSLPKCYGGNALCTANGFARAQNGQTISKACCTGAGAGTCAFDLESTVFGNNYGAPNEVSLGFELATSCTGTVNVTLQGANDDNAAAVLYNYGSSQAAPASGLGNQVIVTNAFTNRYIVATVSNANNDCTDVEAILTLVWYENR